MKTSNSAAVLPKARCLQERAPMHSYPGTAVAISKASLATAAANSFRPPSAGRRTSSSNGELPVADGCDLHPRARSRRKGRWHLTWTHALTAAITAAVVAGVVAGCEMGCAAPSRSVKPVCAVPRQPVQSSYRRLEQGWATVRATKIARNLKRLGWLCRGYTRISRGCVQPYADHATCRDGQVRTIVAAVAYERVRKAPAPPQVTMFGPSAVRLFERKLRKEVLPYVEQARQRIEQCLRLPASAKFFPEARSCLTRLSAMHRELTSEPTSRPAVP